MDDKELKKFNDNKDAIMKYISRLYSTTSVTAEASITEDLISRIKKMDIKDLIEISNDLDVFGKCVFHYRLPIDIRLDIDFSKSTEVEESERIRYWREYKAKLKETKLGTEEEYNKLILMACTLHVPLKDSEEEAKDEVANDEVANDETIKDETEISETT